MDLYNVEPFTYFDEVDAIEKGPVANASLEPITLQNGPDCKYLLAALAAFKSPEYAQSEQLISSLRSAIKKGPTKWASTEWVGQEDLYEACERVLNELRSYEQLKVFNHKVSPREVPDYYDVIKHPMDFSQMRKKLNSLTYRSKQEFMHDLSLIYANCMAYNSHPESVFRVYGEFLRSKLEVLGKTIPDIVLRRANELSPSTFRKPATATKSMQKHSHDSNPSLRINLTNERFGSQRAIKWNTKDPVPHIALPRKRHSSPLRKAIAANLQIKTNPASCCLPVATNSDDRAPRTGGADPSSGSAAAGLRLAATKPKSPTSEKVHAPIDTHNHTTPITQLHTIEPTSAATNGMNTITSPFGDLQALEATQTIPAISMTQAALNSVSAWHQLHDISQKIQHVKEVGVSKYTSELANAPNEPSPENPITWDNGEDVDASLDYAGDFIAHSRLVKPAALLLAHTGFEVANTSTFQVVVEFWAKTIEAFGATLRILEDQPPEDKFPVSASHMNALGLDFLGAMFEERQATPKSLHKDKNGRQVKSSMSYNSDTRFHSTHGSPSSKRPPKKARSLKIRSLRRKSGESLLAMALRVNGFDPLTIQDHVIIDMVKSSCRLTELARRLENKFQLSVFGQDSAVGLDDLPMEATDDAFASGNFLSGLLDEDFFGFRSLGLGSVRTIPSNMWYEDSSSAGYYRRSAPVQSGIAGIHSDDKEGAEVDAEVEFPVPPPFPSLVRDWVPQSNFPHNVSSAAPLPKSDAMEVDEPTSLDLSDGKKPTPDALPSSGLQANQPSAGKPPTDDHYSKGAQDDETWKLVTVSSSTRKPVIGLMQPLLSSKWNKMGDKAQLPLKPGTPKYLDMQAAKRDGAPAHSKPASSNESAVLSAEDQGTKEGAKSEDEAARRDSEPSLLESEFIIDARHMRAVLAEREGRAHLGGAPGMKASKAKKSRKAMVL